MTVQNDKLYGTASVSADTSTAQNNEYLDKLYGTASVQSTTAPPASQDRVYADKLYATVVVQGSGMALAATESSDVAAFTIEAIPLPSGGGDSPDQWWRTPPWKQRKTLTTQQEAPIEAPLVVSETELALAALAEELRQQRANEQDELILLLAT